MDIMADGGGCGCDIGVLQSIANLLLANGIGHLLSSSVKIEVSANRLSFFFSSTKGVVVERILVVVELIAEAIVSILKINSRCFISAVPP